MEPGSIRRAFCTTREASELLGVSLRTAQLWVESGLLEAWKTDGGHRRILRESVERLLVRETQPFASLGTTPEDKQAKAEDEPLSILVAEDDPVLRRLYELTLSRWAFKPSVTLVADGYEALIQMGDAKPDLLITDLKMPGFDGFRMIRSIVAAPQLAQMAVVVVSGLDDHEVAANGGLPAGIPILPKPVPFERLREIAERVLLARETPDQKGVTK